MLLRNGIMPIPYSLARPEKDRASIPILRVLPVRGLRFVQCSQ